MSGLDYPVMTSMPPDPLVTRSSDAGREADMPRNKVQFQKGLSFIEFCQRYGTEDAYSGPCRPPFPIEAGHP